MKNYLVYVTLLIGVLIVSCDNSGENGTNKGSNSSESNAFCNCLEEMQNLNIALEEMDRNSEERRTMKDKIERQSEVCEKTTKEFVNQFGNLSDEEKELKIYLEMMNCPFIKDQGRRMMEGVIDASK